jgi:hypothetical protein
MTGKKSLLLWQQKMKNFFTAILAVLYIGTSSGATIQMHFCMGRLASWGLGDSKSNTCPKCGMEKNNKKDNGCCRDEHKFLKNDLSQKATENNLQLFQAMPTALPTCCNQLSELVFPSVTEENPFGHSPPRTPAVAVHIRHCVFRI